MCLDRAARRSRATSMRMQITPDNPVTPEQTAAHEAGHATVALVHGAIVTRLAMPEHGVDSGICDAGPPDVLAAIAHVIDGIAITIDMLITAAGPVAGYLHRVRWPAATPGPAGVLQQIKQIFQADSRDDYCRLRTMLESAGAKDAEAAIWSICQLCRNLLEHRRQMHLRIAAELLHRRALCKQEIDCIVEGLPR